MRTGAFIVFGGWGLLILVGLGFSVRRWWTDRTEDRPDLADRYRNVFAIKNEDIRGRRQGDRL